MRKAVAILTVLLLGCSEPADRVPLEFSAEPFGEAEVREWSVARTETGDHQVTVRRAIQTRAKCEALEATLMRSGTTYTLRVGAGPRSGPAAGEGVCGYTAVLRDLPSGRYHLRVVHAPDVTGGDADLVMDHPIRIR